MSQIKKHKLVKGQSIILDDPSILPISFEELDLVCHNPDCGISIKKFYTRRAVANYIEPEGDDPKHDSKSCSECGLEHELHIRSYIRITNLAKQKYSVRGFDIIAESHLSGTNTISYLEPPKPEEVDIQEA